VEEQGRTANESLRGQAQCNGLLSSRCINVIENVAMYHVNCDPALLLLT
jgi:hypothetical protein